jgi:hypothetical protein
MDCDGLLVFRLPKVVRVGGIRSGPLSWMHLAFGLRGASWFLGLAERTFPLSLMRQGAR